MPLLFEDAAKAKDAIMVSQQKEIQKLYEDWAKDIADRAKFYSTKTNASAPVSERYYRGLYAQMKEQSKLLGKEIQGLITSNMYTIADSVVASNVNWLKSFGFSEDGLNAAFSYIPNDVVQRLVTGQIYQGGWNLSQRIWSDNQQTQKDVYQLMARGLAEQKSVYEIAKDLESYVKPGAKKAWNPVLAMKNTKTGEIEYKRIYKRQVDYNAQRLARTLAQHSYQQSFIAATKDNPFVTEYIWHSNGSRVCDLCKARDGAHFKKTELPMDHPNGMCTMEPVVVKDMVDQLADWFNSPEGTYPDIDVFAGNFGYEVKGKLSSFDKAAFLNKFGNVSNSNALQTFKSKLSKDEYNEWFALQKKEKAALGYGPGSGKDFWADYSAGKVKSNKLDDFFAKSLGSSSQFTTDDFIAKYGKSTKSPNAWFNSLTPIQKAEAKLLKEQSGLTWNKWYEQNIYSGSGLSAKTKTATKTSGIPDYKTWIGSFTKQTESYMLDKEKAWMKLLSGAEKAGIKAYSGSSYEPMNRYLRYLQQGLSEADAIRKSYISESQLSQLKDAISGLSKTKLDEDLVLRRGSSIGDIVGLFMQGDYRDNKSLLRGKTTEELNNMFQGAIGKYGAFTSTSSIWDRGFDGEVEYVIYAPKGTSASSIMSISRFGTSEGETLLNAGTTVRCTKIEGSDGHMRSKFRVFLEIIV